MGSMPIPGAPPGLPIPRCLVHDYAGRVDLVAEILPGQIAVIGPPEAVIAYIGDEFPFILVRPEMPPRHMDQLLLAIAQYDEWYGDFEPLKSGAFAIGAGFLITRNHFRDVCLYHPGRKQHTMIANFLVPNLN